MFKKFLFILFLLFNETFCFINIRKINLKIYKVYRKLQMTNVEVYTRPQSLKYETYGRPKNDLLLRVIENKNENKVLGKIPIWIMRQAGRYLPEYLEFRKKYDFFEICKNPELSSEVTIMPFKRFSLDMLVIFSDILIIFDAMGLEIKFIEKVGPIFNKEITSFEDFKKLNLNIPEVINNLFYVYDSINLTKKKINNAVPILGFSGSPFTLFMYLTKNNKKTYEDSLRFIYEKPDDAHKILNKLSDICASHLINQIDSGANIIQIFDSNAEVVDKNILKEFSIYYLQKIINLIKKHRPQCYIILFIKDNFHECIKDLMIDVLSITNKQLAEKSSEFYYKLFQNKIILQGALDPHILLLDDNKLVKKYTNKMLDQILHKNKYIANLGHGILPNSKIDNVHTFINTINECEFYQN
ncbi:uroporphyrinogen III decarboxylase, putative [Plasmodium relictum]|uniref:Uroporphyrinogen decarboxylase n=1 Tax=Plasmodium relictum TaxID=85471 RepID=A0A1J1H8U0_PLARL|nr:uroporphyrinogen III decarboxylase, putative [Plasmodium relictum]CRH01061.1 uroporphyrinogen III decarboxylase, putative [Plasmodium relictum]